MGILIQWQRHPSDHVCCLLVWDCKGSPGQEIVLKELRHEIAAIFSGVSSNFCHISIFSISILQFHRTFILCYKIHLLSEHFAEIDENDSDLAWVFVNVNSEIVARDFLENQSHNYSDGREIETNERFRHAILNDAASSSFNIVLTSCIRC